MSKVLRLPTKLKPGATLAECRAARKAIALVRARLDILEKATEDRIIELTIDEHREALHALADGVLCPGCGKVARGPKYNLGEAYNWAEGCQACGTRGRE
jgi:hypothetical protein